MKKNNLLKTIAILFFAYVVLSWIIPGGTFSEGQLTKTGTSPLGIGDIFIYPISTSITSIFVLIGVCILLIGALYGVMNATGAYKKLVEGLALKFKGKEKSFLVISILMFAILSSLTTLYLPLFVLVPLFVAVILSLGYNKMTALLSTVGAILVGMIGTTYGYNTGGYNYINYFFELGINSNIIYKVALFVLVTVVLLVFVIKTSKLEVVKKKTTKKETKSETKKTTKKEVKEDTQKVLIPLYDEKQKGSKKATGLVIILALTVIISLVSMFNWAGALGVEKTWFDTVYTKITEVKLNGYPIFANILGSINPFGYWSNYEFAMLLMISILLIGLIYNLKCSDLFEAVKNGMKEMIPVAVVVIFANVLLLIVNSVDATFFPVVANALFGVTKGLNVITMSLISGIGSIMFSDFPYLMNALYDPIKSLYTDTYSIAVVIMQAIYGFVMMIVPTSVILVAGLSYLDVSYKEWLKNNWKLLVSLLIAILIVSIIMILV